MTGEEDCKEHIMTDTQTAHYEQLAGSLKSMGAELVSQIESKQSENSQTQRKQKENAGDFWVKYEQLKKMSGDKKEGMTNIRDVNGMLFDSDLFVVQQNYLYAMWSIAAAAGVLVALKVWKSQ